MKCGDVICLFLEEERFVAPPYSGGLFSVHRKPSTYFISS